MTGARNDKDQVITLLTLLSGKAIKKEPRARVAAFEGLAKGLKDAASNRGDPGILTIMNKFFSEEPPDISAGVEKVKEVLKGAQ